MIRVDYCDVTRIAPDEATEDEFDKWLEEARAACAAISNSYDPGNPPEVDRKLYSDAKKFLRNLFADKCAYCEQPVISNQDGDVEHYRPKNAVHDIDDKVVMVALPTGKSIEHPGYRWLAYEWSNLLLSCKKCNQRRKEGKEYYGKGMRFPVAGTHAHMPHEVGTEKTLLIHPGAEDPDALLEFKKNGRIDPRGGSEKGGTTIRMLGLNRNEPMTRERANKWEYAASVFREMANDWTRLSEERRKKLEDDDISFRRGETAFAAFVRAARREVLDELEKARRRIMADNAGPGGD